MSGRGRLIRVIAAMGLLLVGPAILAIPTYRASERLRERYPRLERALARSLDVLNARSLSCRDESASSDSLTRDQLWKVHRELEGSSHAVGLAAFSVDDWEASQAMDWALPGTRGLAAVYEVDFGLAKAITEFEMDHPVCVDAELAPERLREEEQRSAAEVAAYRARLEPFVARLAAARAALERDRPVLAAMAWSLGVIEVVGWALFLVVLRQEYRAWRGRRASRSA
jgi:hypothetical protein